MKSECGTGLTLFLEIVASHKQCQSFDVDEVADQNDEGNDDDESDGNENDLMTTTMRTKKMMMMKTIWGW